MILRKSIKVKIQGSKISKTRAREGGASVFTSFLFPKAAASAKQATQQTLKDNGKPRKKRKEKKEFLFLNFARCGECGYCVTADRKIKKNGREYVYYFCTRKSKIQKCSQHRFLREENFAEQVKENCQKVSLPDVWRERYLDKLKVWEDENRQTSDLFAQNLKKEISAIKTKIDRLMDGYLEGSFELEEFQEKKQTNGGKENKRGKIE